jgi:8-oxo-dGTP diphosphatase
MKTQRIIVNGILPRDGKVLIAKRSLKKKIAPGKYHLPGGHVEFGEEPVDALKREFSEEFALEIEIKDIFRTFSYMLDGVHTIGLSFVLSSDDDLDDIKFDTDDNEQIEWVDMNNLGYFFEKSDHDFVTLSQFFGA